MRRSRRMDGERLEVRRCLSTFGFEFEPIHQPVSIETPNLGEHAEAYFADDVDRDGDLDLIVSSSESLYWLENRDGGSDFRRRLITLDDTSARQPVDLDNDGDLDLVAALVGRGGDAPDIVWYPNNGGTFGGRRLIASVPPDFVDAEFLVRSLHVGDIDADGWLDVLAVSASSNHLAWYRNRQGVGIFDRANVLEPEIGIITTASLADLDQDGDLDLLLVDEGGVNLLLWRENTDGRGRFGNSAAIGIVSGSILGIETGDVDQDDDVDFAVISSSATLWFENRLQGSFVAHELDRTTGNLTAPTAGLAIADVDNDGDVDILATSWTSGTVRWYENREAASSANRFQAGETIVDDVPRPVAALGADLNNDGRNDLIAVGALRAEIVWRMATTRPGSFTNNSTIYEAMTGVTEVLASDVDGDGDIDLVVSTQGRFRNDSLAGSDGDGDRIVWYENENGFGQFSQAKSIDRPGIGGSAMLVADIDGDDDDDIVSASWYDGTIRWYENGDGRGSFNFSRTVAAGIQGLTRLQAGDIDGDGDLDILSASSYYGSDEKVFWFENRNGSGDFADPQPISSATFDDIRVMDVDGDGDLDVIAASSVYNRMQIVWFENQQGRFGDALTIENDPASAHGSIVIGDVDGDGDLDIVSAFYSFETVESGHLAWYENRGQGEFSARRPVGRSAGFGTTYLELADIDGDHDLDLVSATPANESVCWRENRNGMGDFGDCNVFAAMASPVIAMDAVDFDGDGKQEVVAASEFGKLEWARVRLMGDANHDEKFDSGDLVAIFQIGHYEDDIQGNSSYNDGDWNGDEDFTTADLVAAFQAGTYATG